MQGVEIFIKNAKDSEVFPDEGEETALTPEDMATPKEIPIDETLFIRIVPKPGADEFTFELQYTTNAKIPNYVE